jgi:thymidylate kinase
MGVDTNPVFVVEGVDGCGKSTLIENLKKSFGTNVPVVIHSGKPPKRLKTRKEQFYYQQNYFNNLLLEVIPKLIEYWPVILDRSHIGEAVYSPMYRGYYPTYIWNTENAYQKKVKNSHFILLKTNDFDLRNDGNNFDYLRLKEEQDRFIDHFAKFKFSKKIITVREFGKFKDPEKILEEALTVLDGDVEILAEEVVLSVAT